MTISKHVHMIEQSTVTNTTLYLKQQGYSLDYILNVIRIYMKRQFHHDLSRFIA
jgi:hypothetical protein